MKYKHLIILLCLMIVNIYTLTKYDIVLANTENNSYKSCIIVEKNSGKCLYNENVDEKLPIASIVKLMTLYLTFEAIDKNLINIDSEMHVSEYASSMGGSQLFLDANTNHKVSDLIKSVVIASANDSAVVLAENIAGSENNFVKLMNKKAKELNMNNTFYVDSTGLNEDGYSTASDVAKLASLVLDDSRYKEYSKIWLDEYIHSSGRVTELVNTNKLIRQYDKCVSGKTGTTEKAGYCFVSLACDNEFKVISVILGANSTESRFTIAKEKFIETYANYKFIKLYQENDFYKQVKIKKSKDGAYDCYIKNDFGIVVNKNDTYDIKENLIIYDKNLPIIESESIGKIDIYVNSNFEGCVELIANKNVEKANYLTYIKEIVNSF